MLLRYDIEKKFFAFANEYIVERNGVVVGLSGGAESVVLLHLLDSFCKERDIPLYALHVNHMIRGEEANGDQAFCEKLCKEMEIPIRSVRVDIPSIAEKEKKGLEETARDERYSALYAEREALSASYIALAHSSSDNLETMLINIARGSSLRGAMGIPPTRDFIIRPLIDVSGEEIRSYASLMGYDFKIDSTNSDTDYTRNKIRSLLVPILKEINPEVESAASRLSYLMRKDSEYLEKAAAEYENEDRCEILATLDAPILGRVLRNRIGSDVSFYHISKITDLLKNSVLEFDYVAKLSLPRGITALISSGRLSFVSDMPMPDSKEEYLIRLKGETTDLPYNTGSIIINPSETDSTKDCVGAVIYTDKDLYVRPRQEHDTILVRGMKRKVKKILNEMKIPKDIRASYPIVVADDEIVWIPGYSVSDKYSGTKNTDKSNEVKIFFLKGY
jgi:tRNA(Ile)-lysidine synthase